MNNLTSQAKGIVAEVLEVDADSFDQDTSLIKELEAESLDLLDILFKLSKATGVKVSMQDIQNDVRGGLEEEQFLNEEGFITEEGINKIRIAFADDSIDLEEATSKDVLKLITVKYILKFYEGAA